MHAWHLGRPKQPTATTSTTHPNRQNSRPPFCFPAYTNHHDNLRAGTANVASPGSTPSTMRSAYFVARDMAFFDPVNFDDEPITCTATADDDDAVLCVGSDDDAYPTSTDRLLHYEHQATRF